MPFNGTYFPKPNFSIGSEKALCKVRPAIAFAATPVGAATNTWFFNNKGSVS